VLKLRTGGQIVRRVPALGRDTPISPYSTVGTMPTQLAPASHARLPPQHLPLLHTAVAAQGAVKRLCGSSTGLHNGWAQGTRLHVAPSHAK
jgi:hypothetical protein